MSESHIITDCMVCKKPVNTSQEEIACTICNSKFHERCVKQNDNMQTWCCPVCPNNMVISLQPPAAPRSKRSRHLSKGKSSTTSSKAQALLQSLEEEKKLLDSQAKEKERLMKETHEQQLELLKKRQDVLQEIASSKSGISKRSALSVPSVNSREKVKEWIDKQVQLDQTTPPLKEAFAQTDNHQEINKNLNQPSTIHLSTMMPGTFAHSTFNVVQKEANNRSSNAPQKVHSSTQMPMSVAFANSNDVNYQIKNVRDDTHASSVRHNLTREEVAARHVVKELPKFDGNPRAWPRFIASFHRSTEVCGFSDSENLERLANSLIGRAYTSVESSLTMEENVSRIVETLEMLFGKPEFIINSLIDEMKSSPPPSEENLDTIIRYSLEVENISSTMKVAKLSEHLWNPILLSEMVERLPCHLKLEWATYKYNNPQSNIEVFGMWLKQKAMTYATVLAKPPNLRSSSEKRNQKHSLNLHQAFPSKSQRCIACELKCQSIEDCETFNNMTLNEKWNVVKKHQLCRICLNKHKYKMCSKDVFCGIDGCQYRHHNLLHKKEEPQVESASEVINLHYHENKTLFKILPVCLRNGTRTMNVFAMLDDGSSLTLIDNKVAKALDLKGESHPLCLRWTKEVERRDNNSKIVNVAISSSTSKNKEFMLSGARTVENLMLPTQPVNMDELCASYEHLKGIPVKPFENAQPLILIGLNHTKLLAVKKYRFGENDEVSAAKTALGWCVFGSKSINKADIFHINHCDCESDLDHRLEEMVKRNYSLDAIGVSNLSTTPRSDDDKRALKILDQTVKFNGSQYEVGLLWRYNNIKVPNNMQLAVRRHKCLEKRFGSEPELKEMIKGQLKDYLLKGYVRKVQNYELTLPSWFLPIFVVRNHNKPNKIRLVWDAAAEMNGMSLNKMLLKGPDLLVSLPGILLRFREHKVALTGDIKEMFHQIAIKAEDRRFQRFIWRNSADSEFEIYEMNVMTFGASCSPSCSQYIKNINAEKFREEYKEATRAIQKNHYVDDWLESVDSAEDGICLAREVRHIHLKGGFEIRNWISNSSEVVENLNQATSSPIKNLEAAASLNTDKILGMFWRTSDDVFTYVLRVRDSNAEIFSGHKVPTKREVLRILMSVFDPLGLIVNILIYPKILLQRIWRSKISWDDEINEDHHAKWMIWTKNLNNLMDLEIPRWIGLTAKGSHIEMHCFVDASEDAFGAVIYFKVDHQCSLVLAKSRVAPLQGLSIPRLELQAAVLGARLAKFVQENLSDQHQIVKKYFWSDSETVMKWLNSDSRRYTQFVGCRIGEILENSGVHEWNWIAGSKNVADLTTKMKVHPLSDFREWLKGPAFLSDEIYPVKKLHDQETTEELRPQFYIHHIDHHDEMEFRVEKWTKLRRIFGFVIRFVRNVRLRKVQQDVVVGPLSCDEYIESERYLLKKAQIEGYAEEYSVLKAGGVIRNKKSQIFKDSPFIDEYGIIRSKGRVQAISSVSFAAKNPVLLPRDHRITTMILQFYHERYHHQYPATVLNEVKQKFIIPRLKVKLNTIRNLCQSCKIRDARPDIPEESELPPARITPFTRPFTFVGIDYFGPITVIVSRKHQKRWCMLVTCLTTRAVHIEVSHTLSTDSCILSLRRFMSRRGKPREIFTDNGTNFVGSRRELREVWENIDKQKLAETFVDTETRWMFIPPASPHMGGAWERMVRSIKTSLKIALPTRTPNDELLLTMLAEVENIVNNRPLTYVPVENESDEALTPNHLILGSTSGVKPLGSFQTESSSLRANWHKSQFFANNFWKRWMKEYLPMLNRRTKWFTPNSKEIQVDDIVIVLCEEKTGRWPKGRVLEVHRGRDGFIRSAKIQLEYGVYTRPVSKLALLDLSARSNDGIQEFFTSIPGGTVETHTSSQELSPTVRRT